jgi:hypothetical protein
MSNWLIFSDLHLTQQDLPECTQILDEIIEIKTQFNIDTVANLGDTFDQIKPPSECIDLFASFIDRLNCKIILLAANSHESTTETSSIVNHFGILNKNINVVKEYIDGNNLYLGHFFIKESKLNVGETKSLKEFKEFKHVVCGHQHLWEVIPPNFCHVGSARFVDFAEANTCPKKVLLIKNYGEINEKCKFLNLKSPYPMLDINNTHSLMDLTTTLQKLSPNSKIRVINETYEAYKNFLAIENEFRTKFIIFKHKNLFESTITLEKSTKKNISFEQGFQLWIEKQDIDNEVKKELLEEIK